jgi:hypothetical protein
MRMKNEFIADCLHLLNINKPLDLKVKTVINDWDASYLEETRRHIIEVSPQSARCRLSLIAHELVHAALTETHPDAPDHGKVFRKTAAKLQKELEKIGWKFKDKIYLKGVDN